MQCKSYRNSASMAGWSSLPGDLLLSISKTLNSDLDLLRLRSVCSSWRSFFPPPIPSFFPLKVPALLFFSDLSTPNRASNYFFVKQIILYRLSLPESDTHSSDSWLFKVSETNPNSFTLLAPLTTAKLGYPPGILPKSLNLLNYRISEISRSYTFDFIKPLKHKEMIRKVISLPNFFVDCDFALLVLQNDGCMTHWKFGDEIWTQLDVWNYHIHDIIFFEGKCYALDVDGRLISFDSELNAKVDFVGVLATEYYKKYLLEFKSDLYVVSKCEYDSDHEYDSYHEYDSLMKAARDTSFNLRLFKKCNGCRWTTLWNLGDIVLFVDDDVSFGVSAMDLGGCIGNCVVLTYEFSQNDGNGVDIAVYDLNVCKLKAISEFRGYAKLFGPPPSWLVACAGSATGDQGETSSSLFGSTID